MNLVVRFLSRDRRGMVSGKKWDSMSDMTVIPYRSVSHNSQAVLVYRLWHLRRKVLLHRLQRRGQSRRLAARFTSGLILTVRSRPVRPCHRKKSKGSWMKSQKFKSWLPF